MMTKHSKIRPVLTAAILVATGALAGGFYWVTHPTPIADCIQPLVDADIKAATDNQRLVEMGKVAAESGSRQVRFERMEFFSCTRIDSLAQAWPHDETASAAYNLLQGAPSFELGRYITKLKQDVPDLEPDRALSTAKLMRATGGVLEALAQLKSCSDLATANPAALEEFITLSEPYLTAIAWNLGLAASPENARVGAQSLMEVMAKTVEAPTCSSQRMVTELNTLRDFKTGQLPGLPCQLKDNPTASEEQELVCG